MSHAIASSSSSTVNTEYIANRIDSALDTFLTRTQNCILAAQYNDTAQNTVEEFQVSVDTAGVVDAAEQLLRVIGEMKQLRGGSGGEEGPSGGENNTDDDTENHQRVDEGENFLGMGGSYQGGGNDDVQRVRDGQRLLTDLKHTVQYTLYNLESYHGQHRLST